MQARLVSGTGDDCVRANPCAAARTRRASTSPLAEGAALGVFAGPERAAVLGRRRCERRRRGARRRVGGARTTSRAGGLDGGRRTSRSLAHADCGIRTATSRRHRLAPVGSHDRASHRCPASGPAPATRGARRASRARERWRADDTVGEASTVPLKARVDARASAARACSVVPEPLHVRVARVGRAAHVGLYVALRTRARVGARSAWMPHRSREPRVRALRRIGPPRRRHERDQRADKAARLIRREHLSGKALARGGSRRRRPALPGHALQRSVRPPSGCSSSPPTRTRSASSARLRAASGARSGTHRVVGRPRRVRTSYESRARPRITGRRAFCTDTSCSPSAAGAARAFVPRGAVGLARRHVLGRAPRRTAPRRSIGRVRRYRPHRERAVDVACACDSGFAPDPKATAVPCAPATCRRGGRARPTRGRCVFDPVAPRRNRRHARAIGATRARRTLAGRATTSPRSASARPDGGAWRRRRRPTRARSRTRAIGERHATRARLSSGACDAAVRRGGVRVRVRFGDGLRRARRVRVGRDVSVRRRVRGARARARAASGSPSISALRRGPEAGSDQCHDPAEKQARSRRICAIHEGRATVPEVGRAGADSAPVRAERDGDGGAGRRRARLLPQPDGGPLQWCATRRRGEKEADSTLGIPRRAGVRRPRGRRARRAWQCTVFGEMAAFVATGAADAAPRRRGRRRTRTRQVEPASRRERRASDRRALGGGARQDPPARQRRGCTSSRSRSRRTRPRTGPRSSSRRT